MKKKKPTLKAQGVFDIFKIFDEQTILQIKSVLNAIDTDKIKYIFDSVKVEEDGWLSIKINLKIRG